MSTEGFVAISRKLIKTPVVHDREKLAILLQLIFKVRFRETEENGIKIGVNQFLCTQSSLAKELELSDGRLRYMLKSFEKDGYLSIETVRNRYTIITLSDNVIESFLPDRKKASDDENGSKKLSAGNKESKKLSAENEESNTAVATETVTESADDERSDEPTKAYGEFDNVYLTADEYEKFGRTAGSQRDAYINKLSAYLENNPQKKYRRHYALLVSELSAGSIKGTGGIMPLHSISPDPTASYDIKRAEERAKNHVPKLKKREKR